MLKIVDRFYRAKEEVADFAKMDAFEEQALRMLLEDTYSIVITDLRMPRLDGMELIREVQSRRMPVTIIVTTGHGSIVWTFDATGYDSSETKPVAGTVFAAPSFTVTIPPGTNSGQKLRLRGKGLPNPSGSPGDLYAEVRIVSPKKLSAASLRIACER